VGGGGVEGGGHVDGDLAGGFGAGEFDGVGDEVDEDLENAAGIEEGPLDLEIGDGCVLDEIESGVGTLEFGVEHFERVADELYRLGCFGADDEEVTVQAREGEYIVYDTFLVHGAVNYCVGSELSGVLVR
jgi:hypothetical protein